MKSAFRTVAALLALTAFSLFQVEGLWAASACMDMGMPPASQVADAGSHADGCSMGGSEHSHERDGKGHQGPACPLVPAGASCIGGAALFSSSDEPALGIAEDEFSIASSDHAKDLLLAVSLLRPPRA